MKNRWLTVYSKMTSICGCQSLLKKIGICKNLMSYGYAVPHWKEHEICSSEHPHVWPESLRPEKLQQNVRLGGRKESKLSN